jgi:hypothetical protein
MMTSPPPKRRFTQPRAGEDWNAVAARELADVPREQAIEQLKSWNLHLTMRRVATVTPSDIIFLEPPSARGSGD